MATATKNNPYRHNEIAHFVINSSSFIAMQYNMSDFGRHFYICLNHIGRVVVSTTGALASSGFVPCNVCRSRSYYIAFFFVQNFVFVLSDRFI
jgi:hypothetical protein